MEDEDKDLEIEDEEELSKATHVLDTPAIALPAEVNAREKLGVCTEDGASYQLKEIESVAASLPQYDVSEALTQSIMRAVEAEPSYSTGRESAITVGTILALAMSVLFVIEAHESVGGILSWIVGLAVMYSISLLVSSSPEAETV